ncbi:MAG: hypothetical protein LBU04_05045 [Christensenellaceae bacterium]|jgi:hypothetical protein|nr:hypothetical protein [Christensenellaceae bacterium]
MKNQFKSTSVFHSETQNPICEMKSANKASYTCVSLESSQLRRSIYFKFQLVIALIAVIFLAACIVDSAITRPDNDAAVISIESNSSDDIAILAPNDAELVSKAVSSGDFSKLLGVPITNFITIKPLFANFSITIDDPSIAIYKSGKIYGIVPGLTTVSILSSQNTTIFKLNFGVLDSSGRLYYKVSFEVDGGLLLPYNILTGKSLTQSNIELPPLPHRDGFTATEWMVNNESYDKNQPITSDLMIVPRWSADEVLLTSYQENFYSVYGTTFNKDLSTYLNTQGTKLRFTYIFNSGVFPSGMKLTGSGIFSGTPSDMRFTSENNTPAPYVFSVRITDTMSNKSAFLNINFFVAPKPLEFTFSNYSNLSYNGQNQTLSVVLGSQLQEKDIGFVSADVSFEQDSSNVSIQYFKNAGTYKVTVKSFSGERGYCYIPTVDSPVIQISVKPVLLEIEFLTSNEDSSNFNFIYGRVPNITAIATNLIENDTCVFTVAYSETNPKNVGSYTAYVLAVSNPNYELQAPDYPSHDFNIVRAEIQIEMLIATKIYGTNIVDPITPSTTPGLSDYAYCDKGIYYPLQINNAMYTEHYNIENELNKFVIRHAGDFVGDYAMTLDLILPFEADISESTLLSNYSITSISTNVFRINKREAIFSLISSQRKIYDGLPTITLERSNFEFEMENETTGILFSDLNSDFMPSTLTLNIIDDSGNHAINVSEFGYSRLIVAEIDGIPVANYLDFPYAFQFINSQPVFIDPIIVTVEFLTPVHKYYDDTALIRVDKSNFRFLIDESAYWWIDLAVIDQLMPNELTLNILDNYGMYAKAVNDDGYEMFELIEIDGVNIAQLSSLSYQIVLSSGNKVFIDKVTITVTDPNRILGLSVIDIMVIDLIKDETFTTNAEVKSLYFSLLDCPFDIVIESITANYILEPEYDYYNLPPPGSYIVEITNIVLSAESRQNMELDILTYPLLMANLL